MNQSSSDARRRERDPVGALVRLLAELVESDGTPMGIRDLARSIGVPPSSLQRTLDAARATGLVASTSSGQWSLGWEFFRLATLGHRHQPFAVAGDILHRLCEVSGETSVLTVYNPGNGQRMFVDSVASRHSIRFVPELYLWMPMHAGATALSILAHRPREERDALYAGGLDELTPRTLTVPGDIENALGLIRSSGYAVSDDEVNLGGVAVAAPIETAAGVTSSVGVILPRQRYDPLAREGLIALVREAASELSRLLGDPSQSLRATVGAPGHPMGREGEGGSTVRRNA